MKKLIILVLVICAIYYFVFSNSDPTVKEKAINQIQTEDRALDYDIKYKEAVEKIDEAVEQNLEKAKTIDMDVENALDDIEKERNIDEDGPPD